MQIVRARLYENYMDGGARYFHNLTLFYAFFCFFQASVDIFFPIRVKLTKKRPLPLCCHCMNEFKNGITFFHTVRIIRIVLLQFFFVFDFS